MNLDQKKINSLISNHEKVVNFLKEKNNLKKINTFITVLYKILKNNGTVFWCGNGGSAADCQHLSAELIGRFKINRKPYRSISLTTDTSAITAISNDFSYEKVFSRQLEGLGTKKDLLFVFSTSGNSKNIINAMITAKKKI
jgi:D-sedoheptulose 7-phosphate isomerase